MKSFKILFINFILILILGLTACASEGVGPKEESSDNEGKKPEFVERLSLQYATEFTADLYEYGYVSIHVTDGNSYVLVPKGKEPLILDDDEAQFITIPCENIYLAASSAMDLFNELNSLGRIKSCSTKYDDFVNESVSNAIKTDQIKYVGKYSAPDFEKLLSMDTDLAIESTMIYHSPKIKEELERMNIPVFVERSSYEKNPLGRLEWIKLYGLLLGESDLADSIFENQVKNVNRVLEEIENVETKRPKVVFFYLSSNGYVNVRKPGDYVSKMIEMAGGEYAFDSLKIEEENSLSTVNISWEDFYYYGKDADILIYNGTIDGGILTKDDLINSNALFEEFKAVKNNMVYCTNNNMYQESSKAGDIILELFAIIHQKDTEYNYLKKVN